MDTRYDFWLGRKQGFIRKSFVGAHSQLSSQDGGDGISNGPGVFKLSRTGPITLTNMSDTKAVRRYQAGVERALGLFDASNEWADYIAFLSRLLKALQASPPGAGVPSKATLARYLAQCLLPSLPA